MDRTKTPHRRVEDPASGPGRPSGLGWHEIFHWLGQGTLAAEHRAPAAGPARDGRKERE